MKASPLEIVIYSIVGVIIVIWLFYKLIYKKYIKPKLKKKQNIKAIEEEDHEHDEN